LLVIWDWISQGQIDHINETITLSVISLSNLNCTYKNIVEKSELNKKITCYFFLQGLAPKLLPKVQQLRRRGGNGDVDQVWPTQRRRTGTKGRQIAKRQRGLSAKQNPNVILESPFWETLLQCFFKLLFVFWNLWKFFLLKNIW